MTTLFLGLDISTTGAKALLIDAQGGVVASHTTPQPISHPYPLWSEQNPDDWWGGIVESIRAVLGRVEGAAERIAAIGLTGQMHGLVCLNAAGQVLRPAILWNDQRTQAECEAMTEAIGAANLIALTGNRALTGFTAPKLLWLRQHEPHLYAQIRHILLPKDYLRFQLSGDYASEMSDAAGTSLLNVRERRWSTEVLAALDIPEAWLPTLYEGTQVTGVVHQAAAQQTGLRPGTPIVGGGGDQAAGAVGVGAIREGVISLVVGTSGVVFAPLHQYAYEPEGRLHAFCHALPDTWHFMGVMLSAAGSLQWFRDVFAPGTDFETLIAEAANIPAGSEGLLFLPYLTGERTPHPDPLARGAFVGLTARHQRGHLIRAVLEGVAFGLKDAFELMKSAGLPGDFEVRVSGGGAKSRLWRQILSDVLNAPLISAQVSEGAAYGAALLAGVHAGLAIDSGGSEGETVLPRHPEAYMPSYGNYQALYPALQPIFYQTAP